MRLQSETKITVGNKVIGGPHLLVCLSLVAAEKSDLFRKAEALKQLDPDLLEWRIDGYDHVHGTRRLHSTNEPDVSYRIEMRFHHRKQ